MAKGYVIVDIPDRCEKCEFQPFEHMQELTCPIDALPVGESRPIWCPIKPLNGSIADFAKEVTKRLQ